MYVGLKQPHGDGERYVTPARAAVKETKGLLMDTAVSRKVVSQKRKSKRGNVESFCG